MASKIISQNEKDGQDETMATEVQEREHMLQSSEPVVNQPVMSPSQIPDEPPPPYPGVPIDSASQVPYQPKPPSYTAVPEHYPEQYVQYAPVRGPQNCYNQMPFGQTTITVQQLQRSMQDRDVRKPNSYIALSFITCMCCNMPFGLVGLIFSAMSETHYANNRHKESRESGKYALMCDLAGIIVSISTAVFILAMSPNKMGS